MNEINQKRIDGLEKANDRLAKELYRAELAGDRLEYERVLHEMERNQREIRLLEKQDARANDPERMEGTESLPGTATRNDARGH